LDIGGHLRLARPAVVLARDADDAAGVDDVVRRIKDAGRLQRRAVLALRELVVGSSRDDACPQPRDRLGIEHAAERTGREHIDIERQYLIDRHGTRLELLARPLNRGWLHIRNEKLGAIGREKATESAPHTAKATDRAPTP